MPKAHAHPTKAFFVRMLTRDISLDDCILDLVDNSIDGALQSSRVEGVQLARSDELARFEVNISLTPDTFTISDNCGGIQLDEAIDYAFTFGRRAEEPIENFSVGVYGIGMKRAVFKLGRKITIHSTYRDGDKLSAFEVPIDVDRWMTDDAESWDFDIEEAEPAAEAGVTITVTELLPETRSKFEDPTYARSLERTLARDYLLPLLSGLVIRVNGRTVQGRTLEFRTGGDFTPMRWKYNDGDVEVEVIAGMLAPPPDNASGDEAIVGEDLSGWYVACNGRIVLAADRTATTGWGGHLPRWHPQYAGFVGLVLFTAANPLLLPMTTTKRNVDSASEVYRRALVEMAKPARTWIDYTNARKQSLETAHQLEAATAVREVSEIAVQARVEMPTLRPKPREKVANVNFAVPLRRMRALASGFGNENLNFREVGLRSFNYAYDRLVDEEES